MMKHASILHRAMLSALIIPLALGVRGAVADGLPPLPAKAPFANPQDAIVARKAGFKESSKIFKIMKRALASGGDVQALAGQANWLADWGQQMAGMFPDGSENGHRTHARPAIWSDRAKFNHDAEDFANQAKELARLAQANDRAGFAAQYQRTDRSCGACHKSFRERDD
jgi:cytochrome c556